MKKFYNNILLLAILFIALLSACKEKKIDPKVDVSNEISRFVWNGLNEYYLWVDDVDKLSADYFEDTNAWYKYLNTFGDDYEGLFYDLLYQYGTVDRFSWIVDDYVELENSFAGISKTMGHDFRLVQFSGSDYLFGYVRYVVPDSPADIAGIKRGDLFRSVDGTLLDVNNYYGLLFEQDAYLLGMASYDAGSNSITLNGTTHDLTAVELQENPIHYSEIMDIGGVKTAYLVYNSFTSNFDFDLNDLFTTYASEGVERLILDLRYNGGGSIQTAIYLASMIYSNNTNTIFSKVSYNSGIQNYLLTTYGADYFNYYFENVLYATSSDPEAPLTSLGLQDLYVITTDRTASASELVINGLKPFIDVTQVGETTYGKYVGSITVKDWDSQGNVNPNHLWAMQPIILKTSNSLGVSDYYQGLAADLAVEEDIVNLLPFGNPDEVMLKAVVDDILGLKSARSPGQFSRGIDYDVIVDSRDILHPHSREMYIEKPLILK